MRDINPMLTTRPPERPMTRCRDRPTLHTKGYTQLLVLINYSPYGGHVVATPTNGTAALDVFVLESLGWTDEADDLPLSYAFSYANGQASRTSSHRWCRCRDQSHL